MRKAVGLGLAGLALLGLVIGVALTARTVTPQAKEKSQAARKSNTSTERLALREIKTLDASDIGYRVIGNKLAFQKERDGESWLLNLKTGKEEKLVKGSNPVLTKAGVCYIGADDVYFQSEGKKPERLWLKPKVKAIYDMDATPSGDRLILTEPAGDGAFASSNFYFFDRKRAYFSVISLPVNIIPADIEWISENEALFNARVSYYMKIDANGQPIEVRPFLENHAWASLSPNGELIAAFDIGQKLKLDVLDAKTKKMRATYDIEPGIDPPASGSVKIVWLSNSTLAVQNVMSPDNGISVLELYKP